MGVVAGNHPRKGAKKAARGPRKVMAPLHQVGPLAEQIAQPCAQSSAPRRPIWDT